MNLRNLVLSAGLMASVATGRSEEIRRVTLDGMRVTTEELAKFTIPGQPNPEKRPQNPILELHSASKKPALGTVLLFPGGGYAHLAVDHEGGSVANMFNQAGWDVAILLYHVDAGADTRALALGDARKALALLQTRGADYGLSSKPVGVMGFSAGGHLAARLAYETASSGVRPPEFLILGYPAYLEVGGKLLGDVAPINVPTFVFVGDHDTDYYPNSVVYKAACDEKNIPCTYLVAAGAGHGFGLHPELPAGARSLPDQLVSFLAALPRGFVRVPFGDRNGDCDF